MGSRQKKPFHVHTVHLTLYKPEGTEQVVLIKSELNLSPTYKRLHSNFQGEIMTPLVGLINSLQWIYFNSKNEFKELFFRSENYPRY